LLVLILSIPLFFTSKHLGKTLGILVVIAVVVAWLISTQGASGVLQGAYRYAMQAAN
jgi:hypothetical protein